MASSQCLLHTRMVRGSHYFTYELLMVSVIAMPITVDNAPNVYVLRPTLSS